MRMASLGAESELTKVLFLGSLLSGFGLASDQSHARPVSCCGKSASSRPLQMMLGMLAVLLPPTPPTAFPFRVDRHLRLWLRHFEVCFDGC